MTLQDSVSDLNYFKTVDPLHAHLHAAQHIHFVSVVKGKLQIICHQNKRVMLNALLEPQHHESRYITFLQLRLTAPFRVTRP